MAADWIEWFKEMWSRLIAALQESGSEEAEELAKKFITESLGPIAEHGLPPAQEKELKEWLRGKVGPLAHILTEISDEISRKVGQLALEAALEAAEKINPND